MTISLSSLSKEYYGYLNFPNSLIINIPAVKDKFLQPEIFNIWLLIPMKIIEDIQYIARIPINNIAYLLNNSPPNVTKIIFNTSQVSKIIYNISSEEIPGTSWNTKLLENIIKKNEDICNF